MTLEQLTYFAEAYRQKSITKAAENLFISRQAISNALQKLEEEFHVSLFTRSANRITPTAAADDLYQTTLPLLNAASALRQTMATHAMPTTEKQTIRIGMTDAIISLYGDEIAEKLHYTFPDVHFLFLPINFATDLPFYQEYDFFFTHFTNDDHPNITLSKDYAIHHLTTKQSYVWLSANSPLAKQPILTMEMLKDHRNLILNGIFNTDVVARLYSQGNTTNVKLKASFLDYIENFDCYATDSTMDHGRFVYAEIFKGRNIVAKKTDRLTYFDVIYKKSAQNFLPIITSIIF